MSVDRSKRKGDFWIILEPVTCEETFGGLEHLKVEIGTGGVICMANDLLPVDE